ncbi:NigD-like N-terminal domain-containing protein, partial [Phocaeicola vulgatus]|nr:NigD-like N-terminal domain-containing protein [Phocaeicola vulgatus]
MKKLNLLLLAFLAVMGVTFQSCDDDDGYSLGDVAVDWATVNVKGAHVYDFTGDRWGQIWPATTDYFWYSPIDGQRVILYFNPLYDNYGSPDKSGGKFFNSIENLHLCTMNNQGLLALAQLILPSEILSN